MTTYIDYVCIENDVTEYYCYAMFSHKWEANELLLEKVVHIVIYNFKKSHSQQATNVLQDHAGYWVVLDLV